MPNVKPKNAAFATRLKALRADSGLTQQELAQALDIDRSTYTYYETGKTRPQWDTLQRLAGIFRVSVSALLGEERLPYSAVRDNELLLTENDGERFSDLTAEERLLLLQFRQLSGEGRTALTTHMKDLLD